MDDAAMGTLLEGTVDQVMWNDKTARVKLMVHGPMDVSMDVF